MAPENEEPRATWQDTNTNWVDPYQPYEMEEMQPLQANQVQVPPVFDTPEQEEVDGDDWVEPPSSFLGVLRQFMRQFSAVLLPLLLAVVTFLIILPTLLTGRGYLPEVALLPLVLLLIILAAAQGTLMRYAGSNVGLGTLYIAGGVSLFLLFGCFAIFGPFVTMILFILLLIINLMLARRCIHPTPEGSVDLVYTFGKYTRTIPPGLNFLQPWESSTIRLNISEILWSSTMLRVPISRDYDVQFTASISYQLMPEDAYLAAANVRNWEESLHERFLITIQSVINQLSPEDFITWQQSSHFRNRTDAPINDVSTATRWDRVNATLLQHMQEQVHEWGVQINWVGIRDLTLMPHLPTAAEMSPNLTARHMDAGVARGAPSFSQQRAFSKMHEVETPERMPPQVAAQPSPPPMARQPQAPPASATPVVVPPGGSEEDALAEAYNAVRRGSITDPETIRGIARRFEAVSKDTERSKIVGFDAGRAAYVLYQRAQVYEEQANEPISYESDTQPDWQVRRPANDNLMTGG